MADTMEDLKKMKVAELKQALKERGLPLSGTKPDLIKRLGAALGTQVDQGGEDIDDDDVLEDDILNDDTPVAAPAKPAAGQVQRGADKTAVAVQPAQPAAKPAVPPTNQLTERKETNSVVAVETTVKAKIAEVDKLTAAERLKLRAEKFGAVSIEMKKELRAKRFGVAMAVSAQGLSSLTEKTNMSTEEVDRLKKRAERFGTVTSTSLSKADQDERKRKRAERFGISSPPTASVKTTISVNSTDSDLEAKKRKRAERFGIKT